MNVKVENIKLKFTHMDWTRRKYFLMFNLYNYVPKLFFFSKWFSIEISKVPSFETRHFVAASYVVIYREREFQSVL